ncbi:uncharacterized protein LOC132752398 [Ruditapes philippinarum]|uniref:uncharacterized protein LOC132752398 n=1 Tax=Ruditapes philippinarum TaxID=129788 RepID=UPI00295B4286|nr:uncharacterized protein LOC132752398 [Ruditapes philippinarum]
MAQSKSRFENTQGVNKKDDLNENEQDEIEHETLYTATPVDMDLMNLQAECEVQTKCEEPGPFIQECSQSYLDVSLNFHDYTCEPVPTPSAVSVRRCNGNPSKLNFNTGIPNEGTFNAFFEEMTDVRKQSKTASGGRPNSLRLIDEFFMFLMRLRLGLLVDDLAARFCISSNACSRLLNKWIDYLDVKLNFLIMWPSKQVVKANMPKLFRDKFPDTRVIIDCTEIKTETPSSLQLNSMMYSDYKSHNTWKSLNGISPSGQVTFVSDLWVGSISDKQLTKQSGIINLCEEGDAIMADRAFTISDLTAPKGIKLIIPPFKRSNCKFSKREVQQTRDIANARIHVERQIERILFALFAAALAAPERSECKQ